MLGGRATAPVWDSRGWTGRVLLPSFAALRDRWSPYGEQPDRRSESERQGWVPLRWLEDVPAPPAPPPPLADADERALVSLLDHEEEVCQAVLAGILASFRKCCLADFAGQLGDEALVRRIDSEAGIGETISLSAVRLQHSSRDDIGCLGLDFNATWSEDHGVGVILHGRRIVTIEAADIAYCFRGE